LRASGKIIGIYEKKRRGAEIFGLCIAKYMFGKTTCRRIGNRRTTKKDKRERGDGEEGVKEKMEKK